MRNSKANLKLKAAIVERGYSIEYIANKMGLTKASLSRKIAGITRFYEEEIQLISILLKKPVTDIFFNHQVTEFITN